MPLTIRLNKSLKHASRYVLLGGIACVTLYLSACDITGNRYKNGPVKFPSKKEDRMTNEVSRMEAPKSSSSSSSGGGLNPKNLFGKSLRSDDERLDRLERAMQDLRNDFDNVRPSVKRLMGIEADMQSLLGELRRLSNQAEPQRQAAKPMAPAPAPAPQAMAAKPAPKAAPKKTINRKTPPPASAGTQVYDVRIGEHPGKTRIVLDTNAKTSFSIDIDNNERIMVVDLPQAQWSAANSKNLGSKTVSSYRVESSDTGSLLIFQLKKNTEVLSQSEIPGTGGAGRRIVIDLR